MKEEMKEEDDEFDLTKPALVKSESKVRSFSLVDQELAEKKISEDELTPEAKLERMMKMLKQVAVYYKTKFLKDDEKGIRELHERTYKVLDMNNLTKLFDLFSDLLVKLDESDLNQRIKNIASVWFSCYEEDFRAMDHKISKQENINKPSITMAETIDKGKETPKLSGLYEKNTLSKRLQHFIDHAV